MTDFSARTQGREPRGYNTKDSQFRQRRRRIKDFTPANEWVQCWGEGLPRFEVGPNVRLIDNRLKPVMVARCKTVGIEMVFAATMDYGLIRQEIDDKILEIMRHDAQDADAIDRSEWEGQGLAIDFDEFMGANNA